jgi:hypothetical protein
MDRTQENDRLTQHKRFVPDGTHPIFCYAKTSFMLGKLYKIRGGDIEVKKCADY